MVQIYKTPFAAQGDKDAIPVPVQGDGAVSVTQGFGYDYEREYEDPAAKDIRREIMNGILHDLSEAIGEMQQFGFAAWQPVDGGWPIGANVNHGGGVWQSLANANTEEPGTGALWRELLFSNLVPASETNLGLVQLATVAQAQALTDDANALTPKKLADAFGGANGAHSGAGYQRLPGGLILQWGVVTGTPSATTSGIYFSAPALDVSFPITFPNASLRIIYGARNAGNLVELGAHTVNNTINGFSAVLLGAGSPAAVVSADWLAIGF